MIANGASPQVAIVGGGPVGLFLACELTARQIRCKVLEQRTAPSDHSRAIGIHPVSLDLFGTALGGRFVSAGKAVRGGQAYAGPGRHLGTLSFERCAGPYPFVLVLPQGESESLLEQRLHELDPEALVRGVEVVDVQTTAASCGVSYKANGGADVRQVEARFVVGCDGKRSMVRDRAGIAFEGATYPDSYAMGDFEDQTPLGDDGALFLHRDGVVESFPLPQGLRRFVVRLPRRLDDDAPDSVRGAVQQGVLERTGYDLNSADAHTLSTFGVEHYVASAFVGSRVALAGDAAHVTSPIGGQGMNAGWRDAWHLSIALDGALKESDDPRPFLRGYELACRPVAKRVIKRAELYMWLGRRRRFPWIRENIVRLALHSPLRWRMADMFTMRGL